jgi:4-amino-4-deoxy-L-arabinose transferase-like glycosyltransferase
MENKKRNIILIVLLSLYLLIRLPILFSSDAIFYGEEIYMGTVAKELIDGPRFPIFDYQFTHYQGGTLLVGILAVPFYILFGVSIISLKLVGLSFSIGILILVYLFLNKFFNPKVAILGSLLFILSPPYYTTRTLMTAGDYLESIFFSLLIMLIFYQIFFDNKKNYKYFILFGILSGFSLWVHYTALVMIFICLVFWFIFDKKFFFKKYFIVFVLSFLVGFSPLAYYNFTHDFLGIGRVEQGIYSDMFSVEHISRSVTKFGNLVIRDIPVSYHFRDFFFLSKELISYTYHLIFIFSICVLIWLNRESIFRLLLGIIPLKRFKVSPDSIKKESFIIIYPIMYSLIYSLSAYQMYYPEWGTYNPVSHTHIFPLFPFIFMLISLVLIKIWKLKIKSKTVGKIASIFLISIVILIGLISNLSLINLSNWGKNNLGTPYNYRALAQTYGFKFGSNPEKINENCIKFENETKPYCYLGMGQRIGNNDLTMITNVRNCEAIDIEEYKKFCFIGIGAGIGERVRENVRIGPDKCNRLDPRYRNYCYEGLGVGIKMMYGSPMFPKQVAIDKCNLLEKEYINYCINGLKREL